MGQAPEILKVDTASDGKSAFHQLLFFGLLLETSKSYLCNTSRIQSTFLLVTSRNVGNIKFRSFLHKRKIYNSKKKNFFNDCFQIVQQSDIVLCCDEFVEFTFVKASDCCELLKIVCEIRQLFLFSIENKLNNDNYGSYRDLERKIVKFSKLEFIFR